MKIDLRILFVILFIAGNAFADCCSEQYPYKVEGGLISKSSFAAGNVIYQKKFFLGKAELPTAERNLIYTYLGFEDGKIRIKEEAPGTKTESPDILLVVDKDKIARLSILTIDLGICGTPEANLAGFMDYQCKTEGEELLLQLTENNEIKVSSVGKPL